MLTDKAKEDFEKWFNDYSETNHNLKGWKDYDQYVDEVELPLTMGQALIIEWLDSVGIIISIYADYDRSAAYNRGFYWEIRVLGSRFAENTEDCLETRQEATSAAIETANKIYNTI